MQESMIYQDIRILQKGEERAKKQEALLDSNSQSDLVNYLGNIFLPQLNQED